MDKNLFQRIKEYENSEPVRFHVPSHKGRGENELHCFGMDITELDFSDNLNSPSDVIEIEEQRAAKIFGVQRTIFTVNGATAGIIASIIASVKDGEKLLLPFNSHISCYYGAIHSGADIVRLPVADHAGGVSYAEIQEAVQRNSNIKACVITNPTYYGCCNDIKKICAFLKQHNIIAIVDESHGTHFNFSDAYPLSALKTDADIVIHSGHKTINGLTQTALIHILTGRVKEEDVRFHLRMLQSTSPSYILLLSLIRAVNELNNMDNALFNIKLWYNNIYKDLFGSGIFRLLNYEKFLNQTAYDYDPLKICLSIENTCKTGYELMTRIQQKFNILGEMAEIDKILFAAGLHSKQEDFRLLSDALLHFDQVLPKGRNDQFESVFIIPERIMPIKEAANSAYEYRELNDCAGEISADFITVYPPGCPYIIPGERIDNIICEQLQKIPIRNITGIKHNKVKTVKR